MATFEGLPKELFKFLLDIRFNNNREWFQANKDIFLREVKQPLYALAAELGPVAQGIDSQMETRPERTVSRIYRDARRVRGGDFYRDAMWISFKRNSPWEKSPFSYFIYVNPEEYGWGCGFWNAPPDFMQKLRLHIDGSMPRFTRIAKSGILDDFELTGEDYKRAKKTIDQPQVARFYNKKYWSLEVNRRVDSAAFLPDLACEIARDMQKLAPVYHFVMGMED